MNSLRLKKYNEKIIYIYDNVTNVILAPLAKNKVFFINLVLLMVIPSVLNAYWINFEQYVTISPIYKYGIKVRDGASFPYILFVPFVLSYSLSFFTLLLHKLGYALYKYSKILIYLFLFVLFFVDVFLLLNYGTMMSPSISMLLIETNTDETTEFLSTYLICNRSLIAYAICFIMALYIVLSEHRFKREIRMKRLLCCFLCVISVYMFQRAISPIKTYSRLFNCQNLSEAELWYLDYPVNTNTFSNLLYSLYIFHLSKNEMNEAMLSTITIKDQIQTSNQVNIVMIIGESFNKYHSSLYGYYLPTNPLMEKEVEAGRLFVFDDVISSYNLTSFVIRNLFSTNSIMDDEKWYAFPAFPILFKKAGWNVYFWDNQRTFGKADVSDFSISSYLFNDSVAKKSYTAYNDKSFQYDGELIDDFFNRIVLSGDNNLVIFHLMGQHTMPIKRYPNNKDFEKFKIKDIRRNDLDNRRKQLLANYDNATLYNDKVVHDVIDHFSEKNAVVIYFSDHGEEIYDFRDHYGRTQETTKTSAMLKAQYEIPFMIWCSTLFADNNKDVLENIKAAQAKPFMNDNVCQILMGIVGMKTIYYHPERDLISPCFLPYNHRIVQNSVNYEKIRFGR